MSIIRIDWHGEATMAAIKAQLNRAIYAGGTILRNRAIERVSIDGSGKVNGRRVRGVRPVHSLPGESPRSQSKQLRQSITVSADRTRMTVRVGSPMIYGPYLELGTRHMAPRPWLRRSYEEVREQIEMATQRIMSQL